MQALGGINETACFANGEEGFGKTYIHDFAGLIDPSTFPILNTEKICLPHENRLLRVATSGKVSALTGGSQMKKKAESKPKTAAKPADKPAEKTGGAKKGGKK
jgi:hypothetical protein